MYDINNKALPCNEWFAMHVSAGNVTPSMQEYFDNLDVCDADCATCSLYKVAIDFANDSESDE